MTTIELMKERHSIRKYDSEYKIPEEDLHEIIEAASQAPSSWNLQHWRFLAVQSDEKKQELLPIAYNQQQVQDSSVTIAILGDKEANQSADTVFDESVKSGVITDEVKNQIVANIHGAYEQEGFAHKEALINASLAAMQLMLAAKEKGYDSVPMGGFDKEKLMEAFNIPDRYIPIMLISLGKGHGTTRESFRFPVEDVLIKESF
ncbi:nitroreductase family protein [Alteribacillus bidgolensis]|uniref:Nitroreductase n=1 Tax=Alteribacillus bidgolensis TaxID=930129 RepID=A0A1G8IQT4_9BACI|nr:nitroreductase family protein [Alteribacillus bidgolensis]SDI21368.1 Nitroreductase [Alteribacillus bidgolensis]